MNLIEWLKSTLEGYFLVRNYLWGTGIFFFVLGLLCFFGKKHFIWKFTKFLICSVIGIFPFYLSTLLVPEDIAKVYNENLNVLKAQATDNPKEMLKVVNERDAEFNKEWNKSITETQKALKGTKISFSKRQIVYVARGAATEKMKLPMIHPYVCDDSMRFGRRTARKLFPKLNIERWMDVFGIPKD
jgi:hypothetical protein